MTVLNDFELKIAGKSHKPLMIGGMGVDISTTELALAAAKCGAIGHISDAMSPYVSDRKFKTNFQNTKRKKFKVFDNINEVQWDEESAYQSALNHVKNTMEQKKG